MLAKRIIACMDVKNGKVVKGVKFKSLKEVGDPIAFAEFYDRQGADEVSFLDVTASSENKRILLKFIESVSLRLFIPFSVGGGIRNLDDIKSIIRAGAEKVSIGTTAVKNPALIRAAANQFGSQAIVISIDAKRNDQMKSGYEVYIKGGRESTGLDALRFSKQMQNLGAGEILLNAIDADGTKQGYDIQLTRMFSETLTIPIIASGGAGDPKDILDVLTKGKADAALAASIFHYYNYTITQVKDYLQKNGVEIRR